MRLETAHLHLLPYSPEHLLALIEGVDQFEQGFGMRAAEGLRVSIISDEVSPAWLAQLRASTVADPWLHGFAVVHREHDLVIGSAGFVGPPNEDAAVEIAYGIVPGYQGRGYATEAAAVLTNFAFTTGRVQVVCAYTLPQNEPSARVLAKCGFKFAGEVIHPEDGLVLRWQCTLERNADDSP